MVSFEKTPGITLQRMIEYFNNIFTPDVRNDM